MDNEQLAINTYLKKMTGLFVMMVVGAVLTALVTIYQFNLKLNSIAMLETKQLSSAFEISKKINRVKSFLFAERFNNYKDLKEETKKLDFFFLSFFKGLQSEELHRHVHNNLLGWEEIKRGINRLEEKNYVERKITILHQLGSLNRNFSRTGEIIQQSLKQKSKKYTRYLAILGNSWLFIMVAFSLLWLGFYLNLKKNIIGIFKELDTKNQLIIEQNKLASIGQISAGIAHEVNNPLMIITAQLDFIGHTLEKEEPDIKNIAERINTIEETSFRIAEIVNGLKNLSRESNEADEFKLVNVGVVLKDGLKFFEEQLKPLGINYLREIPKELQLEKINCQHVQILQVLYNLLSNSMHAVEGLPEKWIQLIVKKIDHEIRIQIVDSGKGISPELVAKIFDPFFTTKEVGKGTGLGLSISKSIIERHGGKFFVDQDQQNTTFVIDLPLPEKSLSVGMQ